MKIGIIGFSREGKSLLKFLKRDKKYRGAEIWVLDRDEKMKIPRGIKSRLGDRYLNDLAGFDVIFRSPGIAYTLPQIIAARRAGIKFSSSTKLFFENCPAEIIGITGSKGKSTVSTLLYKILSQSQFSTRHSSLPTRASLVFFGGNIGKPILDILPKLKKGDVVVMELSSFQLQDLEKSPRIAAVTDIFPEHLDMHKSSAEYYAAKKNICAHQSENDAVFYFDSNPRSKKTASEGKGRKFPVSEKGFSLFASSDLKIKGFHQFRNAVMAAKIAQFLKVPDRAIRKSVLEFPGVPHRLQLAGKISAKNLKVEFYDDSASTNAVSTAAAVKSFPGKNIILIAGGYDKNLDYVPLERALKKSTVRLIVLFGQNKNKIARVVRPSGIPIKIVSDLRFAVQASYKFAQSTRHSPLITRHYVILFSPGAASFDMFKNYADRGDCFKRLVSKLPKRSDSS